MSTTIRLAVNGDEELLAKLNGSVHELHLSRRPDQFKATRVSELVDWYRSLLEKPTTRIWIAEEGGSPVGYVVAILYDKPETPFSRARRWWEIDQIAVEPTSRKKGVARTLVQRAIVESRAEGIRNVETACWSFNEEAHEVFRRLGFAAKTVRFELQLPR